MNKIKEMDFQQRNRVGSVDTLKITPKKQKKVREKVSFSRFKKKEQNFMVKKGKFRSLEYNKDSNSDSEGSECCNELKKRIRKNPKRSSNN